jgi:hypothetical protein
MARKNPVEAAVGVACASLKRMIKAISDRITVENGNLRRLRAELKKLQAQPTPDAARIKALKKSIATLEAATTKDEQDLAELKDVFAENCSR